MCNDSLEYLYCSHNNLSEIVCNDNLYKLFCYENPIIKLNRINIEFLLLDFYIYNNKYYYIYKECTDITFKNDKKIMRVESEIFIIINNYPYYISDIELFKRSKKHYYEKYN